MWQKLMRTWLIGAAVTLATPEGALRAETNSPIDTIGGSGERTVEGSLMSVKLKKHPLTLVGEPKLEDLLTDPICLALMRRDGVTPDKLKPLFASLRTGLTS